MRVRLAIARTVAALAFIAMLAGSAPAQSFDDNPLLLDLPRDALPAFDFTGKTLAGKTIRLSELRGKVVLLNFWATWCVPCLLEMPAMERLSRKLADRPFVLLAVNQAEEPAQVERFARQHRFSFEMVLDPIGEIGSAYGANRLPISYIIDKEGLVVRRAIGPREWDSEAALQIFENLMGQAARPAAPATARSTR